MSIKVGIGQDSHRFGGDKPLILGGVAIPGEVGLEGNSDADVVLHALCNAISGVSGEVVLGPVTDRMCREGTTDSAAYVQEALKTLKDYKVAHVSVSLECLQPRITPHIDAMRRRIAELLDIETRDVGITATSGEGLTAFGRGEGIQAFVALTACRNC